MPKLHKTDLVCAHSI